MISRLTIGQVLDEGTVQRYILAHHPDFGDSVRIDGNFRVALLSIALIPDTQWECDESKAQEFAARSTPFPPVVLDRHLSFIDGGHRHRAAQIRGDAAILALLPCN